MEDGLAARIVEVQERVVRQREVLDELRRTSRDVRRRSREARAHASASMDGALAAWLRQSGVRGAVPPIPPFPPVDLRPPS